MATKQPAKEITSELLAAKLSDANIYLFRERSGFPLSQAQRNLDTRTTYVEDSSLKVFDAKIHSCEVLDNGLILGIIESVKQGADAARVFRPVFFDVFGNVIARPDVDESFPNQKQAQGSFWAMANEIEAVEATLKGIREKQKYLQNEIDKLDDLLKELKT